jgi:PAP2 superfamily.
MSDSSGNDDPGSIARATDPERRKVRRERASGRRTPMATLPINEFQPHETNEDTGRITTFTKGIPPAGEPREAGVLPEDDFDEFDERLLEEAYEGVLELTDRGGVREPEGNRSLANPAAASSFVTTGADPNNVPIGRASFSPDDTDAAPAFDSDRTAAEMVELYWQAITRDIPFAEYSCNGAVKWAIKELCEVDGYEQPMPEEPKNAFRGILPGAQQGPYVSQFLYLPVPRGAYMQPQVFRPFDDGSENGPDRDTLTDLSFETDPESVDLSDINTFEPDYLKSFERWLDIQNGVDDSQTPLDDDERHITTGRDLATYVESNPSQQPYLAAALILQQSSVPLDLSIPDGVAVRETTAGSFVDYGRTEYQTAVVDVVQAALHAAWYRKWLVHRRLRPEEYGGRIQVALNESPDDSDFDFDLSNEVPDSITNSDAVQLVNNAINSALLPQAYQQGSPTHPSYPAGHATTAGACTTVLKAFFNTSVRFGEGFQPELQSDLLDKDEEEPPITGVVRPAPGAEEKLIIDDKNPTVEAELNKLATNMSIGRNWAGVHYRTDATAGYRLGERIALTYLEDRLNAREGDVCLTVPTFFGTNELEDLELEAVEPVEPMRGMTG